MSFTIFNPGDPILSEELNSNFTQNNYGNPILPRDSFGNPTNNINIGSTSYRFLNAYLNNADLNKIYLKNNTLDATNNPSGVEVSDQTIGVGTTLLKRIGAKLSSGEANISYNRLGIEAGLYVTDLGITTYNYNRIFFTQKYNYDTGISACTLEDSVDNTKNSLEVKITFENRNDHLYIINSSFSATLTKIVINPTDLNVSNLSSGRYYYTIRGTIKNTALGNGTCQVLAGSVVAFSVFVNGSSSAAIDTAGTFTTSSTFAILLNSSSFQFSGLMSFMKIGK